nr:hypothetical protein BaRGS_022834 [Batillaria attramentaria]
MMMEMRMMVSWRDGRLASDDDRGHCQECRRHMGLHGVELGSRWMVALQPARDRHEQNVEVLAEGGRLVLHVLKPIRRGGARAAVVQ